MGQFVIKTLSRADNNTHLVTFIEKSLFNGCWQLLLLHLYPYCTSYTDQFLFARFTTKNSGNNLINSIIKMTLFLIIDAYLFSVNLNLSIAMYKYKCIWVVILILDDEIINVPESDIPICRPLILTTPCSLTP